MFLSNNYYILGLKETASFANRHFFVFFLFYS